MAPPRGKYQVKLNAVMFTMMLEELFSGPCTAQHISEATGMHTLTVQRTLRVMHRRGVVRVTGWERDSRGRYSIRVFAFGEGKDTPRPAPKGRTQMSREYRARAKSVALNQAFAGLGA